MTQAQLLADLAGKPFVKSVSPTPTLIETKPDGTEVYQVNFAEVQGSACVYRNQNYYVFAPGTANEEAFYAQGTPQGSLLDTGFKSELEAKILADTTILGHSYQTVDHVRRTAVITALIADPANAGQVLPQGYVVSLDASGNYTKALMTLDATTVANNTRFSQRP